jgi:hypothetical protein
VFDPGRLREIIGELARQARPVRDVTGQEVQHLLTAVDGSVVQTLSTIAEAAYLKNRNGQSKSAWRLHTHFDVDRGVPTRIDVTPGKNSGKTDEKNVLQQSGRRPLLRDGPLVRAVLALQPDQRDRQQLRLPRARQ